MRGKDLGNFIPLWNQICCCTIAAINFLTGASQKEKWAILSIYFLLYTLAVAELKFLYKTQNDDEQICDGLQDNNTPLSILQELWILFIYAWGAVLINGRDLPWGP